MGIGPFVDKPAAPARLSVFRLVRSFISRLWKRAWSLVLVDLSDQEIDWLMHPRGHGDLFSARRAAMIVSRVRLLAGLLAIMTPLWFVLDYLQLPQEVRPGLIGARLAATLGFVLILTSLRGMRTCRDAYRALLFLIGVPSGFYLFSYFHLATFDLMGLDETFALGYAYLPFIMLASLSLFPLTLLESAIFVAPMFVAQIIARQMEWPILNWPSVPASFWLMILISAVSILAGLSQLAFVIVLMRETVRDRMTGCYSRRSAEDLLELQFSVASRGNQPLSLAFIDLDHFKHVNDRFGHDAGDRVLKNAAAALRGTLRGGDTLARWGGEEFLLIMPGTTADQAITALERVRRLGLGRQPDGKTITASAGLAERTRDRASNWRQLVNAADARMYEAKQAGRDRVVSGMAA